jgi:hypothetical protein
MYFNCAEKENIETDIMVDSHTDLRLSNKTRVSLRGENLNLYACMVIQEET